MLIVHLRGGLGNQMFQYALYQAAVESGKKALLDLSHFNKNNQSTQYELGNIFSIHTPALLLCEKVLVKACWNFLYLLHQIPYKETDSSFGIFDKKITTLQFAYLKGYWQSEKYFEGISKTIRNHFSFPPFTDNKNKALLELIVHSNSVSIHIRRGDYLKNNLNWSLDIDYYNRAIDLIKEKVNNPIFYIFSDDMHWAEANIKITNSHFINHNKGNDSFRDMQLMSNCKHNIIANSSFSWWGAWLNNNEDKKVIAPNKWLSSMEGTRDIIPDSWIQL
jgi:hypothetical protein